MKTLIVACVLLTSHLAIAGDNTISVLGGLAPDSYVKTERLPAPSKAHYRQSTGSNATYGLQYSRAINHVTIGVQWLSNDSYIGMAGWNF